MEDKEITDEELKNRLDEEQYRVTQENATEAAYTGKYYKEKTPGMYKCVVCGEPLFDSNTKFDSLSGWPSFFKPVDGSVGEETDGTLGMERTEVHCKKCNAHLGHVFPDAPETPTGNRYCINSASLDLEEDPSREDEMEESSNA